MFNLNKMFKRKGEVKEEKLKRPEPVDSYYLDDNNRIYMYKNLDSESENKYVMIHYKVEDNELIEVNRWYEKTHYFGGNEAYIKKDYNLFLVRSGFYADAIYNYKENRFVLEKGIFDCIGVNNKVSNIGYDIRIYKNYLEEYGCFLGYFELHSTYEEDDTIIYTNQITGEEMIHSFRKSDGLYFALINPDGTIRGNKLFNGITFSRITKVIDLNNYPSLQAFKDERINILNEKRKKAKELFCEQLIANNGENVPPYLDKEVEKVIKLKMN